MTAGLATFATAHGVVDRVHDDAAVARATAEMTFVAGLAAYLKVMLRVGDDADGGTASLKNHAHLAGGHLDDGVLVVARHQLGIGTGRAYHFGTLSGVELDVVDKSTKGDFSQGEGVADFGGSTGARHDGLSNFQTLRAEDITLLTIGIENEGNARAAVGVVFDGFDSGRDTVFVALEVDKAVELLMTTADVAHGHLALVVAAARLREAENEAFLRLGSGDVVVGDDNFVALTRSCRFDFL